MKNRVRTSCLQITVKKNIKITLFTKFQLLYREEVGGAELRLAGRSSSSSSSSLPRFLLEDSPDADSASCRGGSGQLRGGVTIKV